MRPGRAATGLEHDNESQEADDSAGLEDLRQELQAECLGSDIDDVQDRHADDETDRACAPYEAEEPVDEERSPARCPRNATGWTSMPLTSSTSWSISPSQPEVPIAAPHRRQP